MGLQRSSGGSAPGRDRGQRQRIPGAPSEHSTRGGTSLRGHIQQFVEQRPPGTEVPRVPRRRPAPRPSTPRQLFEPLFYFRSLKHPVAASFTAWAVWEKYTDTISISHVTGEEPYLLLCISSPRSQKKKKVKLVYFRVTT